MRHGVAAIGLCSWDRILVTDNYPAPGEYTIVRVQSEQPGGTTANTCHALARLGVDVMLASVVGDDAEGEALVSSLQFVGCETRYVVPRSGARSDSGTIVVSGAAGDRDRTIFWAQGARLAAGDPLPLDEMLEREWVLLDVDDARLRNFLLDLPAHRSPRTKLAGAMTYLVEMPSDEAWGHVLRHDAVFGNVRELCQVTGASTVTTAIDRALRDLPAAACRAVYVSRGREGAFAIETDSVTESPAFPIDVVDTTGAGDAFAAGCLWGLLERCDTAEILRRGNALGGLACRALGARAALPTRDEAKALLRPGVAR